MTGNMAVPSTRRVPSPEHWSVPTGRASPTRRTILYRRRRFSLDLTDLWTGRSFLPAPEARSGPAACSRSDGEGTSCASGHLELAATERGTRGWRLVLDDLDLKKVIGAKIDHSPVEVGSPRTRLCLPRAPDGERARPRDLGPLSPGRRAVSRGRRASHDRARRSWHSALIESCMTTKR